MRPRLRWPTPVVGPEEIGAVLVCTCTSTPMIPSVATWIAGQLGIFWTHASCDIVAACAGLPYGLSDATRILQEVQRPVLVICVEKFSDEIGNVRPSRMIFGDGAAAIVVGVAPPGTPPDFEYLQTYASGPAGQQDHGHPACCRSRALFRPALVQYRAGRQCLPGENRTGHP